MCFRNINRNYFFQVLHVTHNVSMINEKKCTFENKNLDNKLIFL